MPVSALMRNMLQSVTDETDALKSNTESRISKSVTSIFLFEGHFTSVSTDGTAYSLPISSQRILKNLSLKDWAVCGSLVSKV
jgi:hypothetical protein